MDAQQFSDFELKCPCGLAGNGVVPLIQETGETQAGSLRYIATTTQSTGGLPNPN
jgi:hypothetical protein